ncbi:SapC family protein [Catenovulum sediminis]|uniref:SapC family protein n=1 Tax=Catenovulum sediminis TaxID=1740262 RepID=UPI00117CA434|nr:SapC family protein [Catenovulum sediminis]
MNQPNVELLDKVRHKSLKVDTKKVDVAEFKVNASFVVVNELSTLIHEYPIFISKNPTTGKFQLTALLGFDSGQNLFISQGQWRSTYLPLDILRRPFQAMVEENNLSSGKIAIDVNSDLVNETQGERLFTEEGETSDYLLRIQKSFSQLMAGTQRTEAILNKAAEYDLIHSVNLDIELKDGRKSRVNGLYAIDTKALAALTGANLEECHKNGILEVCHLILSSGAHLQKLINWEAEL